MLGSNRALKQYFTVIFQQIISRALLILIDTFHALNLRMRTKSVLVILIFNDNISKHLNIDIW